jgi:carboxyl-terminal processing protease
VGIGATLVSEDDGIVTVTGLVSGGPAARSGQINVGDKIISVGQGRDGVMEDIIGMRINNAVEKIRGQEGTTVRLDILEANGNKKTIEIRRDKIETGSKVTSEVFTVGRNKAGQPCKIGVINLPDFAQGRANEVREIIRDMRNKNVDAIILDLSFNSGGALFETIQTIGFFIETGPIIQRQGRGGSDKRVTNTRDSANEWKGALVILTSRLTASAGEIAAAALQDFGRALIVGNSRTAGFGVVQTVSGIGRNGLGGNMADAEYGSTTLTIQSTYRVTGKPFHSGVVPDIVLPSMLELLGSSEKDDSPQNIAPVFQYPNFAFANPQMIETLKRNSDARIRSNNQFREVQRHIRQHTEKESVSLNERKYLAMMQDASNASKAKLLTEAQAHNSKIVKDFYLDEVLAITSEYVNMIP